METFQNVPTLAGPSSFSPDLHINVMRPMRILDVQNGKLVYVAEQAPTTVVNP